MTWIGEFIECRYHSHKYIWLIRLTMLKMTFGGLVIHLSIEFSFPHDLGFKKGLNENPHKILIRSLKAKKKLRYFFWSFQFIFVWGGFEWISGILYSRKNPISIWAFQKIRIIAWIGLTRFQKTLPFFKQQLLYVSIRIKKAVGGYTMWMYGLIFLKNF